MIPSETDQVHVCAEADIAVGQRGQLK